jgi:hypothetical protein
LPKLSSALLAILSIALLVIGLYWSPFAQFSQESAAMLFKEKPVALK